MRDVCPKCLHRVKPEHMAGTGQGYAQLWRCPECGEVTKMCRWLFKLPEEKVTPTPEQNRRNREKKREWERENRYRINARRRKRYAEDPEYRKKACDARKRHYERHREEILAKNDDCNGDSISITRWCFTTRLEPMFSEKNIWIAIDKERLVKDPALLRLTPPDNWDKLLDDLDNAAKGGDNAECLYSRREGVKAGSQCYGCKLYNQDYGSPECEYLAYADIAARIRKLSGEDK